LLVNLAETFQRNGEFETAITILAPLAELGVNFAPHNLGIAYSKIEDISNALHIYGQIAAEGLAVAEPICFEAMICCVLVNKWPQARFWLSMGTKNLPKKKKPFVEL